MLKNYRAEDVALVFFGIPITGLAPGTFVKVTMNEDAFKLTMGADGDGCRSATMNGSGRVEFTLGQWSTTNDLLSAVHLADKLTGDGIGPFLEKDNSGTSLYAAEKAWIVKFPDSENASDPTNRVWVLESDNMDMWVGGNKE